MNCPDEIADILLKILDIGVLTARFAGWRGNAERAAIEVDHVHNLPRLLLKYSSTELYWYWYGKREEYLEQTPDAEASEYGKLWKRLEPFVPKEI